MRVETEPYDCVRQEYASLRFPGDSLALEPFHEQLDRLLLDGEGTVQILHIGASHVQGGAFSNRLREHFLNLSPSPNAGRGLLFPYRAVKTNNPSNYKVEYRGEWSITRNVYRHHDVPLGLSGIAGTTNDSSACIGIRLNGDPLFRCDFDCLRMIGNLRTDNYVPFILPDYTGFNPDSAFASRIYATYDEPTQCWTFRLDRPAESFLLAFERRDNDDTRPFSFTLNGFLTDNGRDGITYHAVGVNGASVNSYLRCQLFERDLPLIHPDLIIFGIGINDASDSDFTPELFFNRYDSLLVCMRQQFPDSRFVFITNNDTYNRKSGSNPNNAAAREVFVRLARRYDAALWDVYGLMGGKESSLVWEKAGLMKADHVHFTQKGYELLGDLLFNALMDDYRRHLRKSHE